MLPGVKFLVRFFPFFFLPPRITTRKTGCGIHQSNPRADCYLYCLVSISTWRDGANALVFLCACRYDIIIILLYSRYIQATAGYGDDDDDDDDVLNTKDNRNSTI